MILQSEYHKPVLKSQVIIGLNVKKGGKYIDATLGGGGYTLEILKLGGKVLGLDLDQDALKYVKENVKCQMSKIKIDRDIFLEQGNFANLGEIAHNRGFNKIDGIIFDLGMSTFQLEGSQRGFSFQKDEPLDMRMNKEGEIKAYDVINKYSQKELYEIISKYSEELNSWDVSAAIVRARSLKPIKSTGELLKIIEKVLEKDRFRGNLARIFQAIRIEVNKEIENLKNGLSEGLELLNKGGRITVLSYHSLEDREVKRFFRKSETEGFFKIITKSPIRADYLEINKNPKARSAKLRIGEKIND